MGRYICGPSILRLEGRQALVPGEVFDENFPPSQEATLIAAGAIRPVPPEPVPSRVASADVRPSRRSTKKETEE